MPRASVRSMQMPLRIAIPSLLGIGLGMTALTSSQADHVPAQITSDTVEYCGELAAQVSGLMMDPPTALMIRAAALSDEGQHMCEEGQIRAGIARLRRALLMLQGPAGKPTP
jgi:hypothetical protein